MEKLEKRFLGKGEVSGIEFEELAGDDCKGLIRLYGRSDGYYEVVEIKESKGGLSVIGGVEVEFKAKEVYPRGESWSGKCVRGYDRALSIFKTRVRILGCGYVLSSDNQ